MGETVYRHSVLMTLSGCCVVMFAGLLTPAPNAPMLPTNTNLEPVQ